MSDARPITNVTEYVCGSCWNGFGAADPGVRSTGGNLTCPHCGHVQATVGDLTAAVRDAPARPGDDFDDGDPEVGVAVEQPSSSPSFAPTKSVASTPTPQPARVDAAVSAFDFGSADDEPVDFAAEFAAQFGEESDDEANEAVEDPFIGGRYQLGDIGQSADADLRPLGDQVAIAGEYEYSVDTDEDTPVADFVDPEHNPVAVARTGEPSVQFDETADAEIPAVATSATRASAPARPNLKTAEELLAFLDAAEDDDEMDLMFGSTVSTLAAVEADEPVPVVVRGSAADSKSRASGTAFNGGDTTRLPHAGLATAQSAHGGAVGDSAEQDDADDDLDDAGAAEVDFGLVSENTSPDLEAAALELEPAEWKLRAPPGLTYNFHSVDALLGWASNRSTDGLQVSIDGTVWRPVAPFLVALRTGHRGRKAFALAQVPEMVANMSGDDSRSALDDIHDVDVRDEVIRSLEARANGGGATLAGGSQSRQMRPAVPAMDASDLGIGIDDDTLPASIRGKSRASSTMAAEAPAAGASVADAASGASASVPANRPTGKTPLKTTGRMAAAKPGSRADRPATGNQPAVAGSMRRPTSTQHTPVVRKDDGKAKAIGIVAAVVLLALVAVAGLQAAGILHLPLPWP